MRFFILLAMFWAGKSSVFLGGEPQNVLPKILVLIAASDNEAFCEKEQEIWRSYMHFNREHVEAYFVKAHPFVKGTCRFRGDVIYSKGVENYVPGILNKTILALEAFEGRLKEFDYVLRTNVSSFYNFPKMLAFLASAPKTNYYAGTIDQRGVPFASGDGIILSKDLAQMLIAYKHEMMNQKEADDVAIGRFFCQHGIELTESLYRMDLSSMELWSFYKNKIPLETFQFRIKKQNSAQCSADEVFIQQKLVEMFY